MKTSETDKLDEFKKLYISAAPKLIYFASKYVDLATAEDIVQEVFLKLWNTLDKIDFKDNMMSYLFFGVKTASIDNLRHQEVHNKYISHSLIQAHLSTIYPYNTSDLETENDMLKLVYEEIEKLPERCKEIILLSYKEGLSNDQIASALNISKRTVEAQLYKGLGKLRKTFYTAFLLYFFSSQYLQ